MAPRDTGEQMLLSFDYLRNEYPKITSPCPILVLEKSILSITVP